MRAGRLARATGYRRASSREAIVSIDVTPHRSPEVSRQSERRAREIEEARQRLDQVTNRREKQRAGKQSGPNQSA